MKIFFFPSTAVVLGFAVLAHAQGRGGPAPAPARAAAPIDLTGYGVSLIVDEWRFRGTSQKGDILYLPINAAARHAALAWDRPKMRRRGIHAARTELWV